MILDAVDVMYLWFGSQSKPNEQLMTIKTFQEYLKISSRTSIPLIVCYPFQEPPQFTIQFQGWSKRKYPQDKLDLPVKERLVDTVLGELEQREYSKQILLSEKPPEHLDRTCLELYLSDFEFKQVFKMEKAAYILLQPWKREPLRKRAGFF
jgi:Villin headpiece domain